MTLRDYLKIFRQQWWVILTTTVIVAAIVFFITPTTASDEPPVRSYTSTATLLVANVNQEVQGDSLARIALFVTNGDIPVHAAQRLEYSGEPAILAQEIDVETDSAAQAIMISATAAGPEDSSARANAFAEAAVEYFDEQRTARLTLLQAASPIPDESPGGAVVPPSRTIRTLLGAGIGLLLGLGLALVLNHLDNRLRTLEEIENATGIPIIAAVPKLPRANRGRQGVLVVQEPLGPFADGYRAARSAIVHTAAPKYPQEAHPRSTARPEGAASQSRVILVTSALAAEGKTTSVANLAASFAETGQRVLVIDADLRKPALHFMFDVPQGAGVSDFLMNPDIAPLSGFVRPTNVSGVGIISAGTSLNYPASLTSRMAPLVESARSLADIILIDVSPVLAASDAFDILSLVDSAVLVVRAGRLNNAAANRLAELMGRFQVPIPGTIVIGARTVDLGYGYGYGYETSKKASRRSARRRTKGRRERTASSAPQSPTQNSSHPDSWLTPSSPSSGNAVRHGRRR